MILEAVRVKITLLKVNIDNGRMVLEKGMREKQASIWNKEA